MIEFSSTKGDYVVVGGYRFGNFERLDFDTFEVYDNASEYTLGLVWSFEGREVEIITMSDSLVHSKATVKLSTAPEVLGTKVKAVFSIVYYEEPLTRDMKPKGGYLEVCE